MQTFIHVVYSVLSLARLTDDDAAGMVLGRLQTQIVIALICTAGSFGT